MSNTREMNRAEASRWFKFILRKGILEWSIRANESRSRQCRICGDFVTSLGYPIPPNLANEVQRADVILEEIGRKNASLGRIIEAVESNDLFLRFPANSTDDFSIVSLDELQPDNPYSLDGVLVFIGLVAAATVVTSAYLYIKNLTRRNEALAERYETVKALANNKFCEDPDSDICSRWLEFRREAGYNNEEDVIEEAKSKMSDLIDQLGEPLSTGISWAIPIVAGIGLIYLLRQK